MIQPNDVLDSYNVPYDKKIKLCDYLNKYYTFGKNSFNDIKSFIEYIEFYYPNHMLKCKVFKNTLCFYRNGQTDYYKNRVIDFINVYGMIGKEDAAIEILVETLIHTIGLDNVDKFKKYIKNFNNWDSDDFRLFVAERI